MSKQDFCVVDAGPLITLALAGALDVLTAASDHFQFKVLDIVKIEAGRPDRPGGKEITDWIDSMKAAGKLDVIDTDIGLVTMTERQTDPYYRIKNAGEHAIAEWIENGGLKDAHSTIVVYEDNDTRKLLERMTPDADVVAVSTRAFLTVGESLGFVSDAAATWDKIHEAAPTRSDRHMQFQVSTRAPSP
ncbi:MAG: hypothetical protein JNM12_01555 [Alphaproteobacteria bacterium]|nr:hypothetical protein [Alphaproteobacteria bacterium]